MKIAIDGREITLTKEQEKIIKKAIGKNNYIMVPDCIKFETNIGDGDNLGIIFNGGKQSLCRYDTPCYGVENAATATDQKYKLVPCTRSQIEDGDTIFFTDHDDVEDVEFEDVEFYGKVVDSKTIARIDNGTDITTSCMNRDHRYKVVPLEDDE